MDMNDFQIQTYNDKMQREQGVGSALGCMKINLQVRKGNDAVEKFYVPNGYSVEKIISMGKQLKENIRGQ